MFKKKSYEQIQKIKVKFQWQTTHACPAKHLTSLDIKYFLSEPRANVQLRQTKVSTKHPTKCFCFFKISDLVETYCGGGCRQKAPLEGSTDLV